MCKYCDQLMNEKLFEEQGYRSTSDILYVSADCGAFGNNAIEANVDISTVGPDDRSVTNDTYSLHLFLASPLTNDTIAHASVNIKYCPFCGRSLKEVGR